MTFAQTPTPTAAPQQPSEFEQQFKEYLDSTNGKTYMADFVDDVLFSDDSVRGQIEDIATAAIPDTDSASKTFVGVTGAVAVVVAALISLGSGLAVARIQDKAVDRKLGEGRRSNLAEHRREAYFNFLQEILRPPIAPIDPEFRERLGKMRNRVEPFQLRLRRSV